MLHFNKDERRPQLFIFKRSARRDHFFNVRPLTPISKSETINVIGFFKSPYFQAVKLESSYYHYRLLSNIPDIRSCSESC